MNRNEPWISDGHAVELQKALLASMSRTSNSPAAVKSDPEESDLDKAMRLSLEAASAQRQRSVDEERELQKALKLSAEQASSSKQKTYEDEPDTVTVTVTMIVCNRCVPSKTYRGRKWYDKHMLQHRQRDRDHNHNRPVPVSALASVPSSNVSFSRNQLKRQRSHASSDIGNLSQTPSKRRKRKQAGTPAPRLQAQGRHGQVQVKAEAGRMFPQSDMFQQAQRKEKLQQLVSMGFAGAAALQALVDTNNDLESAVEILMHRNK